MLLNYTVENPNFYLYVYCFIVKERKLLLFGDKDTQYLPQRNTGQSA